MITLLTGTVSGFVLNHPTEPSLYVAGDTIWCDDVKAAIESHNPEYIVVNAGAAQFAKGGPITMTKEDIYETYQSAPYAKIIAVHMEALNHCLLTRNDLTAFVKEKSMLDKVVIPSDGET